MGPHFLKAYQLWHEGWGDWILDIENWTLQFRPEGIWRYEIDLERVHTSAHLLDWIFQIHGRVTDEQMGQLIFALDDILNPQRWMCSFGLSRRLPKDYLSKWLANELDE